MTILVMKSNLTPRIADLPVALCPGNSIPQYQVLTAAPPLVCFHQSPRAVQMPADSSHLGLTADGFRQVEVLGGYATCIVSDEGEPDLVVANINVGVVSGLLG